MPFKGWPPAAFDWFDGIAANNNRAWFTDNRPTYDAAVREPIEALLDEVASEFGEGRAFRPNRDTRFAADKSPYKTNAAAKIDGPGGTFYVSVAADGITSGAGWFRLSRDQLERFRAAVDDDRSGAALADIVRALRAQRLEVGAHDTLATAPRGYAKDHPRVELLRQKGMTAWRSYPPAKWMHTPAAKSRIVDVWRVAAPMLKWLEVNVGPPRETVPDFD